MRIPCFLLTALPLVVALSTGVTAPLTVAVFDFESKDEPPTGLGQKVATLISATLSANPDLITVERA
ncbi:MAG TPA: hypothetical protein VJS65_13175, partial [Verrucomicrobiae bacterium]|nr:hypothetical protein [Verrucomicrobiae bacterium]